MNTQSVSVQQAAAAFQEGRGEAAEAICRELLSVGPPNGEALFLLGLIANKAGRYAESVQWLRRAAEVLPASVRLYSALGGACRAAGDMRQAGEYFTRCIQIDPQCAPAYFQLGNVCHSLREEPRAAKLYQRATELDPQNFKAWNNLANTLRGLSQLDAALEAYDHALRLEPDSAVTRCNRALALLSAGRLDEGFREFEWRWQALNLRNYPEPRWNGELADNKTVFVFAEQGLGDTIQFVRYLRLVRQRAGRVIFECQRELRSLVQGSGCAHVVVETGESLPEFDCYTSLLSLPALFGTTLGSIPDQIPYLTAPDAIALPEKPLQRLKVGLVWSGNPAFGDDALRSVPLAELQPVLNTPGISFLRLQRNVRPEDEEALKTAPLLKIDQVFSDLGHAAAAINQLDLVISVDTAVAHLAGALGKRVWLLLRYSPDWRWLLNRTDSPWYPTMRLFRQVQPGEWKSPVAEIAARLGRMASCSDQAAQD